MKEDDSNVNSGLARLFFGINGITCIVGIVLELWRSYHHETLLPPGAGFTRTFGPGIDSLFNQFAFFTTESNLILGITSILLAVQPRRVSDWFHVWRLVGLIDITITGIVFNFVLARNPPADDLAAVASAIQHVFNPVLAILLWFVFGPAGVVTIRRLALASLIPLLYAGFTLVRGALVVWYPYNIMDVTRLGYLGVSLHILGIFILFLIIAGILGLVDRFRESSLLRKLPSLRYK